MEKGKVVYLLGAGASFNAYPINSIKLQSGESQQLVDPDLLKYKSLSHRLLFLGTEMQNDNANRSSKITAEIAQSLIILGAKGIEFGTVDTYAKFLYLHKKHREYENLKKTLAFYFWFDGSMFQRKEPRILHFLTHISDVGARIPEHIKIISWNYDSLFQEVTHSFFDINMLREVRYSTSSYSDTNFVQLNGTNSLFDTNESDKFYTMELLYQNGEQTRNLVEEYFNNVETKSPSIQFAWEANDVKGIIQTVNPGLSRKKIEIARKWMLEAYTLVIIGYSFPYFNREIDKQLMSSFYQKGNKNALKIYFQDPYNDGSFLKESFGLADSLKIQHIKDVTNYHLPIEL